MQLGADTHIFVVKSLKQTSCKNNGKPDVVLAGTWPVASHRVTAALPWQAFVLHPAGKGKRGEVALIRDYWFIWEHMDEFDWDG